MKKLDIFVLFLIAAMVMPATMQAKKMWIGNYFYYEGETIDGKPHGQGKLVASKFIKELIKKQETYNQKQLVSSDFVVTISGIFSREGKVTQTTVEFGNVKCEGLITYEINGDNLEVALYNSVVQCPPYHFNVETDALHFDYAREQKEILRNICMVTVGQAEILNKVLYDIFDKNNFEVETVYERTWKETVVNGVRTPVVSFIKTEVNPVSKDNKLFPNILNLEPDKINFRNGDYCEIITRPGWSNYWISFKRTLPDAVVSCKESIDNKKIMVTYNDGRVFKGHLGHKEYAAHNFLIATIKKVFFSNTFAETGYVYESGELSDPNGSLICEYQYGVTKREVEENIQKRKDNFAKSLQIWDDNLKKQREELSRKYGKKYVDSMRNGRVLPGTPEGLLLHFSGIHRHSTIGNVYVIQSNAHTVGEPWAYYWIYVNNGRVTHVTTKYSYQDNAW